MILLLAKYFLGDQTMKNEKCGACGTYGGEEKCVEVLCRHLKEEPLKRPWNSWGGGGNIKMHL
jgi:hypothetical protein